MLAGVASGVPCSGQMGTNRIALVTGANRGLGLATSRALAKKGLKVLLTSRDPDKGKAAQATLKKEGVEVEFYPLDITNPDSVASTAEHVKAKHGNLDVLVNNAGVVLDPWGTGDHSVFAAKPDVVAKSFEINSVGALRMAQAFVPTMRSNGYGRIVNVSTSMAARHDMNGGWPGYRMSKTALNALTRILADELRGTNVKVNSVCPGWVRTDMGGPNATRSIEQGIETIVWAATLPDDGPTGGFFRDQEPIGW